ncbi:hypothetical protein [Aquabacterium humicola]|uniref:hypothetical protein n=1 Tax=Aquabacterium humicola TaxID=3237377 RepID=UPI002542CA36|nr:hypothetical protein [Rubrivivax pictus]
MKTALVSAVLTAAAFVLAIVLNPSAEQHRQAIRAATAERSPLAGALGVGALTAFASNYRSWGVASYTTINGKTVSYGAFGVVHVVPPSEQR